MKRYLITAQSRNLVVAAVGAFAGLTLLPHLQHEAIVAAFSAAALIVFLGCTKQRRALTLALCGLLGLACTRLTISIVS